MCAVLYHVNDIVILFVCIYNPCDLFVNSLHYIYVISPIEALLAKYSPDYFVGGGDMNTDFSRQNSSHTKTLSSFCRKQDLDYVGRQNSTVEYTYESEMNNVRSIIDHFIISEILIDSVVK